MTEGPDVRSDKSDTVEGRGNASARWDGYHRNLDDDVLAEAFPSPRSTLDDYDEFVRDDIAAAGAAPTGNLGPRPVVMEGSWSGLRRVADRKEVVQ